MSESSPTVDPGQFFALDIRCGTITDAYPNKEARKPSYVLHLDLGPEIGILKSSAQLTALYSAEELIGKQVLAVVNFPPRQVAKVVSQCLVLGLLGQGDEVVLVQPDRPVPNGSKLA